MQTLTTINKVYHALRKKGFDKKRAAILAKTPMGESLAGLPKKGPVAMAGPLFTRVGPPPPPPRPTNAAREAGHAAADRFNAQSDRASMAKYSRVGPDIVAPKGGTVGPKPPPPPGKPQAPAGQIAMSEENAEMIQPSSTRVTPSPGNKILQDLRQSARQRERHPALPAKGQQKEGTGDGSNLQGPSGAKYSEDDVSRPAWQQLPDTDTGDQPSRSDYRNAGFRMLPRQPDDIRS